MEDFLKLYLALAMIAVILSGVLLMLKEIRPAKDNELDDPARDTYITRTDSNLIQGEIYEMELIPAHVQQRRRTEMQAGMGFGVNPANGNLENYYGFFPVNVNYSVEIPDTFILRIFVDDTERLVYFVNEISVSEEDFIGYEVGDIFGEPQQIKEEDFE